MYKNIFLLCLIFLLAITIVSASEEISILDESKVLGDLSSNQIELEKSIKITPDSAFYGIKRTFEDIGLAFTFDSEKKAEKAMDLANKRLVEIKMMSEEGNMRGMDKAKRAHENALSRVRTNVEIIKQRNDVNSDLKDVLYIEKQLEEHKEKVLQLEENIREKPNDKLDKKEKEQLKDFVDSSKKETEKIDSYIQQEKESIKEEYNKKEGYTNSNAVDQKIKEIEENEGLNLDEKTKAITAMKEADFLIEEAKLKIDKTKDLLCFKECLSKDDSKSCADKCLTVSSYSLPAKPKVLTAVTANVAKNIDNNSANCGGGENATICHKPGTPAQQTMNVPQSALNGHIGHGDTCGACDAEPIDEKMTFKLTFDGTMTSTDGEEPSTQSGTPIYSDDAVSGQSLAYVKFREYYQYICEDNFNEEEGTVQSWIKFDRFGSDAVVWHTDDSKYVMYYDKGSTNGYKAIKGRVGLIRDEPYYKFDERDTPNDEPNTWLGTGWHFIVMTWKGSPSGTSKLYVDGELKDSKDFSGGEDCFTFRIGNNYWPGMPWSEGKIDELEMYNYERSPAQVLSDYDEFAHMTQVEEEEEEIIDEDYETEENETIDIDYETEEIEMNDDEVEENEDEIELIEDDDNRVVYQAIETQQITSEIKKCSSIPFPADDFCKNGRIAPVKDKGCLVGYKCKEIIRVEKEKPKLICPDTCKSESCIERCNNAKAEIKILEENEVATEKKMELVRVEIKKDYESITKLAIEKENIRERPETLIKDEDLTALRSNIVEAEKYLNEALELKSLSEDAFLWGDYIFAYDNALLSGKYAKEAINSIS